MVFNQHCSDFAFDGKAILAGGSRRDKYFPRLVRKAFSSRAKARAKAAGGGQFEKSGR
jgi:hypothetical protein